VIKGKLREKYSGVHTRCADQLKCTVFPTIKQEIADLWVISKKIRACLHTEISTVKMEVGGANDVDEQGGFQFTLEDLRQLHIHRVWIVPKNSLVRMSGIWTV
jgi:hypothetical protein